MIPYNMTAAEEKCRQHHELSAWLQAPQIFSRFLNVMRHMLMLNIIACKHAAWIDNAMLYKPNSTKRCDKKTRTKLHDKLSVAKCTSRHKTCVRSQERCDSNTRRMKRHESAAVLRRQTRCGIMTTNMSI